MLRGDVLRGEFTGLQQTVIPTPSQVDVRKNLTTSILLIVLKATTSFELFLKTRNCEQVDNDNVRVRSFSACTWVNI